MVKRPDLVDRLRAGLGEDERLLVAEPLLELGQLVPPRGREAPVAARGSAAADVALEHDDGHVGREPPELERRPQAGVATTDDAHVRARRMVERRTRPAGISLERLLQPPAAREARDRHTQVRTRPFSDVRGTPGRRP